MALQLDAARAEQLQTAYCSIKRSILPLTQQHRGLERNKAGGCVEHYPSTQEPPLDKKNKLHEQ
jgi:hypothetical protein